MSSWKLAPVYFAVMIVSLSVRAETWIVDANDLNLRAEPTKQSTSLVLMQRGETVESLGEPKFGPWLKVKTHKDGKLGWVWSEYLSKDSLTWRSRDYMRVLDGSTAAVGKTVGIEQSRLTTERPEGLNVTIWEYDPWWKFPWNGPDKVKTIRLEKTGNSGGREIYRLPRNLLWAVSTGGAFEGDRGEYYLEDDQQNRSGYLYSTETPAIVIINESGINARQLTVPTKAGVFGIGGNIGYTTVEVTVAQTLGVADPTVDVRLAFPSTEYLRAYYGKPTEPADSVPYNYDTVADVEGGAHLIAPKGWSVRFEQGNTTQLTGIQIGGAEPSKKRFDLLVASKEPVESSLPFVLLGKIQDEDGAVTYYNSETYGFEVVAPE